MNFDSALKRSDCKLHGGISLRVGVVKLVRDSEEKAGFLF